jgi:hypothetical protein
MGYILPALFLLDGTPAQKIWLVLEVIGLGILLAVFLVLVLGEDY